MKAIIRFSTSIVLISVCGIVLLTSGCTPAPSYEDEPAVMPTSLVTSSFENPTPAPQTETPVVSDAQMLEEYISFISKLDGKKPEEARLALDALLDLNTPLPDEAIDTFIAFMEKLCADLDMPDVVGWTGNHGEQAKAECARYMMRLYTAEGYVWVVPDLAAIGVCLYGKTGPAYEAYFNFAILERERGIAQLTNDGILVLSWIQLADYIAGRQTLCDAYPDFSQAEKMLTDVSYAIRWYEGTNLLPHSPPFSKNGLRPEVRESYEYFLENYKNLEGSEPYDRVLAIEKLWRENGDKLTNAVKDFLNVDEGYYKVIN